MRLIESIATSWTAIKTDGLAAPGAALSPASQPMLIEA
jgi:hypothetical protein